MNPRLVALSGPLQGKIYTLTNAEETIGRASANTITINDMGLSRRHCVIAQADGQCIIRDLESSNGTFVNGLPIKELALYLVRD